MKTKSLYLKFGSLIFTLLFTAITNANADTLTDMVSGKIADAGPGGFIRLSFESTTNFANYSIQPNPKHDSFLSVLPVCTTITDLECIESLNYRNTGDSIWKIGKLLPAKNPNMDGVVAYTITNDGSTKKFGPVSRSAELVRPYGGISSSWELAEAPHLGGNEYLLSVSVSSFEGGVVKSPLDLNIALKAVQWKAAPANQLYDKTEDSTTKFNLPQSIEYQVKIRLGMLENRIINWYNGRIQDPKIELSDGLLTVSGKPTFYPIASTNYFTCSSLFGEKRALITHAFGESALTGRMCSDLAGATFNLSPKNSESFDAFDLWDSNIKELGKNSAWEISASSNLGVCSNTKFAGVVSSNALLYTVNPPKFDPVTRMLSYRIASTHLDSTGRLNKGRFNLVLNKDVARCLWGIDAGKIAEAKVQVTYSDGKPIIGTSTMNVSGDWVYIDIENFTFSSPTFNIRAIEEVKVAPTSTPSSSATIKPDAVINSSTKIIRKSTITCFKGKLTKKVTATNPKCPAGYKKK